MPYIRKRSAQLFSKTRFISAQLEAYLENDLCWNSQRIPTPWPTACAPA